MFALMATRLCLSLTVLETFREIGLLGSTHSCGGRSQALAPPKTWMTLKRVPNNNNGENYSVAALTHIKSKQPKLAQL